MIYGMYTINTFWVCICLLQRAYFNYLECSYNIWYVYNKYFWVCIRLLERAYLNHLECNYDIWYVYDKYFWCVYGS